MKVAFVDSGAGGLIFALDCLHFAQKTQPLPDDLKIIHIGDLKNMPYGLKSAQELYVLAGNIIKKASVLGANLVFVACNTMATVIDEEMIENFAKMNVKIVTLIEKSAAYLYKKHLNLGGNIAILSTKRTMVSQRYYNFILEMHKMHNSVGNLSILPYAPIDWEQKIEAGVAKSAINAIVIEHLDRFRAISGKDFEDISCIGLFCTHYPYFQAEIKQYFEKNTNFGQKVQIISQGEIFAEDLLLFTKKYCKSGNAMHKISIRSYITNKNTAYMENIMMDLHDNIDVKCEFIEDNFSILS